MTTTFSITVPHYEHQSTNRTWRVLLREFDHAITLSDKVLRRTDHVDVRLMSSDFRRIYLAFSDLKPFITDKSLRSIEISVRSMADALGEICYQDMAILALEEVALRTPGEIAATIQQFIDTRKEIRRKSRRALERALIGLRENVRGADFAKTITLATRQSGDTRRRKPAGSLRSVADTIIESYLAQFEKSSRLFKEPSPFIELCEIDRATQRLQYAIDLFSDCWTTDLRIFTRSLANLQSALSKVSHCDAWIKELRKQILQSRKTHPRAPKGTLVFWLAQFSERRNSHWHESFALWNAWEADQLSSKLRKTISRSI